MINFETNICDSAFKKLLADSSDDPSVVARHLESRVLAVSATSTARAFEVGALLGLLQDRELFRELGFATFQDFCKAKKLARSTVYRDMAVSRQFSLADHGHLGITRLRLLVNRPDALNLIENGIECEDGTHVPLKQIKSRDLQARLCQLPRSVEPELEEAVQSLFGSVAVTETDAAAKLKACSEQVSPIAMDPGIRDLEAVAPEPASSEPIAVAGNSTHSATVSASSQPANQAPFPLDDSIWTKVS